MNYFIYFTWSHCTGRNELNKLTLLPMCGFIAQLVEHRTGIAEVMGSNPVEALIFFRLLLSNCLNWKIYCDDHTSLSSHTAVQIWIISYIFHKQNLVKYIWNNSYLYCGTMCGFIAQLVEHRTGIAEVMGSNPVEALIFFRLLLSNCLNWKIYCDDHTSLSRFCLLLRFRTRSTLICRADILRSGSDGYSWDMKKSLWWQILALKYILARSSPPRACSKSWLQELPM